MRHLASIKTVLKSINKAMFIIELKNTDREIVTNFIDVVSDFTRVLFLKTTSTNAYLVVLFD